MGALIYMLIKNQPIKLVPLFLMKMKEDKYRNEVIIKFWICTPGHMIRIALEDWSTLASNFSVMNDLHQNAPTPAFSPGYSQHMQCKLGK